MDAIFGAGRLDASGAAREIVVPDVKVNGSDGATKLRLSESLAVTIALESGRPGVEADWWLVADTPAGIFHFRLDTGAWLPGIAVTYQGPAVSFPAVEAFSLFGLPEGIYTIYFALDKQCNGEIDQPLYYDMVEATIRPR